MRRLAVSLLVSDSIWLWMNGRCMHSVWHKALRLSICLFLSVSVALPAIATADSPTFNLEIRARKVVGTSRTVRVKQGDTVTLRWTTDEAVGLHLHGYDIEQVIKPGAPVELAFKAHATGRFPITAHGFGDHAHTSGHSESPLVYIEVLPR
jgi:FtsP/CotA-like multicopper oxidase with cupredoxin domain